MKNNTRISVIIPFFNADNHILNCIDSLKNQSNLDGVEIIMINDGSTDQTEQKIKNCNSIKIKLIQNKKNLGPASARNLGIKAASGEYIYFFDADDELDKNTFYKFEKILIQKNYDLIFSDRKRVLNTKNLRENINEYDFDKIINDSEIIDLMKKRFFNPHKAHRIFDLTGKLIKREIIIKNNIFFEDQLRYLEDECFMWRVLSNINQAKYIKEQLYTYNIRPNVSSGISDAFKNNFDLKNYQIVREQLKKSLKQKGLNEKEIYKIIDQAYIYLIIGSLISLTRSITLKKIDEKMGVKYLKNLIKKIIKDKEIPLITNNYTPYKDENRWIPRAIRWRSSWLLEFFCKRRVEEILKKRKN